jgi:hypothetical protein
MGHHDPDTDRSLSEGPQAAGFRSDLLLLIAVGAIIAPPLVSLVLRSSLTAVWAAPGLFLFVLVAVCSVRFAVDRDETRRLAAGGFLH